MDNPTNQTKLEAELTPEELKMYEEKADVLAAKLSVSKVYPVVLIEKDTFERVVAFLKEPSYITKIRIMDKATMSGIYTAADELRELSIIKEESNILTYGEGSECDKYKLGVTDFCLTLVQRVQNQFKKK